MTPNWDIPADSALAPALDALNPTAVLQACRSALESGNGHDSPAWQSIRMVEASYHPRRYVRAAFALIADDSVEDRRLWPEADIVYLHTPVRPPMSRRGTEIMIDGVAFECYRFPNDRRLRGLRKFAGRSSCASIWQDWLDAAEVPVTIDPKTLQRLFVRFVPEHRWVVRLRAEATNRNTGERKKRRIAVRSASTRSCDELLRRHAAIASYCAANDTDFRVSNVVGANVDQGMMAVEWNRAKPLVELLANEDSTEILCGLVKAIRSFHSVPVTQLDTIASEDMANRARDTVAELTLAYPAAEPRLDALVAGISDGLLRDKNVTNATLHNDLHCDQMQIKRGVYTLLDLDRMAIGDPLIDVANFAMQLRMLGLRTDRAVDVDTARRWSHEFVSAWIESDTQELDHQRFGCYAATSLLVLAHGMMRHLRKNWKELADRCIEVAESALAGAERGTIRQ